MNDHDIPTPPYADLDQVLERYRAASATLDPAAAWPAVQLIPALVEEIERARRGLDLIHVRRGHTTAWMHDCGRVEWWPDAGGPINDEGCDQCEAGPDPAGWRQIYLAHQR